ncbi:MAG: transketolase C-terminal domain-containing protein [Opitutaceae bacterium]|nr:transketolase C-terminal domain-containing protein [Opitutaceae bacterium]
MRELTYAQAIQEGFCEAMARDERVTLLGLGVPDPKGFFGTTTDLQNRFGPSRVLDMPCAEAGMTGITLGAALNGLRPVINHQRLDFALLAMDPMCTQAAKWSYMFGGAMKMPVVFRMILGRGWGQGPQHSQCLHSWFAHIPGLKVVMPSTPADAKGLLISAIEDDNPVVFLEHRWLHHIKGHVPAGYYTTPIGPARQARSGKHVTIVALSYMVLEALEASDRLQKEGIDADVIDLRCLRPLDANLIIESVKKTGHLVVADSATGQVGVSAEIITLASQHAFSSLRSAPQRVCFPECPTPTAPSLAAAYYPRSGHIMAAVRKTLGMETDETDLHIAPGVELDKPNPAFTGPF